MKSTNGRAELNIRTTFVTRKTKNLTSHDIYIVCLPRIDRISGHESGSFLESFAKKIFMLNILCIYFKNKVCSINRWRVGAPRHDIKVNRRIRRFSGKYFQRISGHDSGEFMENISKIHELKSKLKLTIFGWWLRRISGKFFQTIFKAFFLSRYRWNLSGKIHLS